MRIAFIGFGEAAQAFAVGWDSALLEAVAAFDRKTDNASSRDDKRADYDRYAVDGCDTVVAAVTDATVVLSLASADQALAAALAAAPALHRDALFFDINSVSPDTKRAAARAIEEVGAHYVDTAVMAPAYPAGLAVPLLISGSYAESAQGVLEQLGFRARIVAGEVGAASAIKILRSIMIKGIEALTAECLLSAHALNVSDEVIVSLDESFPGWDWRTRGAHSLDRMLVHGERRSDEMREAAATAAGALNHVGRMAAATALWQRRLGYLHLTPVPNVIDAQAHAIIETLAERTHS